MFTKIKDLVKLYPEPEHQEYRVLHIVTEEDAQVYAKRIIGRKLTGDELYRVQKVFESNDARIWLLLETSIRETVSKKEMKEYFVSYRDEIALPIKAKNEDEAIEKFRDELAKRGVEVLYDLWNDMFEVEEAE